MATSTMTNEKKEEQGDVNTASATSNNEPSMRALTGEEKELYDRQIRLWGVEAQRKLASSHILVICDPTDILAQEIAKNIVLAGIARLVLLRLHSPKQSTEGSSKIGPGFLGADDDAVVQTLQSMNPLVDVGVLSKNDISMQGFRVVCAVGLTPKDEIEISERTRAANVPLLCGRIAGEVGWVFVDDCGKDSIAYKEAVDAKWGGEVKRGEFGWHVARTLIEFQKQFDGKLPAADINEDGMDVGEDMGKVETMYKELCQKFGGAHLKTEIVVRAARAAKFSLPPIASVVGGLWGREVIKVIAGRERPLDGYNFFFFNATTSKGSVEKVGMKR